MPKDPIGELLRMETWDLYINRKLPNEPRRKQSDTFHCTGCLIGILSMVYDDPHVTGQIIPNRMNGNSPIILRHNWILGDGKYSQEALEKLGFSIATIPIGSM